MPTSEPGEVQTRPETGEPFVSKPAGGLGGGVTSFASTPATEEEHLASLESEVRAKEAEIADLKQRHVAVSKSHERHKAEQANADTDEKSGDDDRGSDLRKHKADAVVAAADEKRRKENEAKAVQSSDKSKSGGAPGQQSNQSSSRNP